MGIFSLQKKNGISLDPDVIITTKTAVIDFGYKDPIEMPRVKAVGPAQTYEVDEVDQARTGPSFNGNRVNS
jgi:hypothetical protein